jgi:hypothetical protein
LQLYKIKKEKCFTDYQSKNEFTVMFFYICMYFCSFAVFAAFMSNAYAEDVHNPNYIYGRYIENIAIMFFAFGLSYYLRNEFKLRQLLISSVVLVMAYLFTFFAENQTITEKGLRSLHTMTLNGAFLNYSTGSLSIVVMVFLYTAVVSLVVYLALWQRKRRIVAFIIAAFVGIINLNDIGDIIRRSYESFELVEKSYEFFKNLPDCGTNEIYLYNAPKNYTQFAVSKYVVHYTKNEQMYETKIPENVFVVFGHPTKLNINCDKSKLYRVYVDESDYKSINISNYDNNEKIFVYGDELAQKLIDEGYTLDNNIDEFDNCVFVPFVNY